MTGSARRFEWTSLPSLTIVRVEEVDVGVLERSPGDGVTANTDGRNRANHREDLVEHGLSDGGVELSNVEGSRGRETGSVGRSGLGGGSGGSGAFGGRGRGGAVSLGSVLSGRGS